MYFGGNALNKTLTRRCSRTEFDLISGELVDILKLTFKNVAIPLFYNTKETFGDIDILVSMKDFNDNLREYIVKTFKPNEIFHNGNCYSFDYKEVQIDLITTAPEHFDSYYNYLNYNDLGNYLGKIAHGFGLKYGQTGLFYNHYFKGSNVGMIQISKNYDKIFKFLGLSFDRYKDGFDTLEDIFIFVSNSPYFNWEYVQLENQNRINRERDKKRKSYQSFLEWIDKNVKDDKHKYQYFKDKAEYIPIIAEIFPEADLITEIRRLEYEECKSLYIKSKFNGGDVMRKYGFKGKELGNVLNGFIEYCNNRFFGGYYDFVLNSEKETIYRGFENYLNEKIK